MIYPVISLWHPWGAWVASGRKTIETRIHDRFRCLVGKRIAIHAAKRFDGLAIARARWYAAERDLIREGISSSNAGGGVIICTVDVTDCRRLTAADSPAALCDCTGAELWGLILANARPLREPVAATGRQGIFQIDLPEEVQPSPLRPTPGLV